MGSYYERSPEFLQRQQERPERIEEYFASGGRPTGSSSSGRGSTYATLAATEVQPPSTAGPAQGALGDLCGTQQAAVIGQAAPIVFARRAGDRGGVFISPPATDARYENDASNELTAKYHLILGDGPMGSVQVRDVYQCTCRVGSFTQTYNRRAGDWDPGNFLVERVGYTLQNVPDYCGSKGTCEGLTTFSYENTYPDGSGDWALDVQVFIREGRTVTRLADDTSGPSSNFADLFKLAMEVSAKLPADMIDTARLQTAALFLDANELYFDMAIKETQNLDDFIASNAPYFLVRETRVNGKRGLRPLLPIDDAYAISTDPVPWKFEFNEDFIIPGSIQINYTPLEQRKPKLMLAMWRQQPDDTFGIIRTAEVGYAVDRSSGNVEQHDMSLFCTHELHAVRAMAYKRARQKWSTHTISWSCRLEVYNRILEEGDIVRVTYERDGSDGSTTTHDYLYELDQIEKTSTGEIVFQATHFPVDADGRSLVALTVAQAEAQGLNYEDDIRTGIDCDENSSTDTSVPIEVGQIVIPGTTPLPPPPPPPLLDVPVLLPVSDVGVWKLESISVEQGSTLAVGSLIEIPEPSTISKRIVQVNTAVDVSDVITWSPDTDDDTDFSIANRSVAKKDISYWDPEECPRSASTLSGAIYVRTYDSDGNYTGSQTPVSSRELLEVDCDNDATESNTLTYVGPGEIRDYWSDSALPGSVSDGILTTSLPIPEPDLPGEDQSLPEPPPGGYPPPPVPPAPIPTPPDDPVDPCEPICTSVSICGEVDEAAPTCPAGTTQVGIITAHQPDGDQTCVICEDCEPPDDPSCAPASGAGVWKLSALAYDKNGTRFRYYAIEIPDPFYNGSGQLVERRIVQDNRSVTAGDVLNWTPNTDTDTFFSVSDRSISTKTGISYWDEENCPTTASTNAGRVELSTWVDGVRDAFVQNLGTSLLRVDCDINNAQELLTLTYIGPGQIRDWWSDSALPGAINSGVLTSLTPIPETDLPGPS